MISTNKEKKINLVLGPGGAKGFVHVGAMKGLIDDGFSFQQIVGVSMGAIMGWLYSVSGDIDLAIEEVHKFEGSKFLKAYGGLIKMDVVKLKKYLLDIYDGKDYKFDELKIPLIIAATNIHTGKTEYIHEGSVVDAIIASSSIPFVNKPFRIEDSFYLDGGIRFKHKELKIPEAFSNDLPTIGIAVIDIKNEIKKEYALAQNFVSTFLKARYIHLGKKDLQKMNHELRHIAPLILAVDTKNIAVGDFHKAVECLEIGEEKIKEEINAINNFFDSYYLS